MRQLKQTRNNLVAKKNVRYNHRIFISILFLMQPTNVNEIHEEALGKPHRQERSFWSDITLFAIVVVFIVVLLSNLLR